MSFDERALIEHVTQQRWYGAKSRGVAHAQVLDSAVLRTQEPQLALALVEVRYETGVHDLYQLLFSFREGEPGLDPLGDDPALARELVSAMRSGLTIQSADGAVEFQRVEGFPGLARELGSPRAIDTEQSNTSIAFDDEVILKVFRRLEPGINPELELLRFLTDRGFQNIAALGGWYAYSGGPLATTLGILQEYARDARDGWELALDDLEADPERFLGRLHRLGEVTGELHTVLASDETDPSFAPEIPSVESLGLLTATVDEEIAQVFLSLPEDDERLAPIAGRGEEVRDQLRLLTHAGTTGMNIRTHGDFHLGQTLWSGDDWVLIDFEGEPARSLPERRRKRSPLRDVAGMLRSFAYVAIAAGPLRGVQVPDGWEAQARERFLDGYLSAVDPALLPNDQVGIERLLAVYELEKAVYELRYELDNRPEWVGIPVAAIQRLIDPAAAPVVIELGPDPHATLGAHAANGGVVVRAFRPEAKAVRVQPGAVEAELKDPAGLWEALLPTATLPLAYELEVEYPDGNTYTLRDPYSFLPTLGELDLHLVLEGRHEQLYERLGAHVREIDGVAGTSFAVWAPNARTVAVVGDFNSWDRRLHPMRSLGAAGIWELFVPTSAPASATSSRSTGRTAASASRRIRSRSPPRCRRRTRPSSTAPSTSGRTRSGWSSARSPIRCARRCPSTRCTSARGAAIRSRGTGSSPISSWPTSWRTTSPTSASRTSSCCR